MQPDRIWGPRLRTLGALLDAGQAEHVAITRNPNRLEVNWHNGQGLKFSSSHSLAGLDHLQTNMINARQKGRRGPAQTWEICLRVLGQQFDESASEPEEIRDEAAGLCWWADTPIGARAGWREGRDLLQENHARAAQRVKLTEPG